jgi:hypothetical protein
MMQPDVLTIAGAVVVTSLGVALARRSARRRMTDPRDPVAVRKMFERDVAPPAFTGPRTNPS